ncbi:MAG TPA: ThiF family adenylyltransferase [Ktedonobacterales bacterium]|jgi:molybdopterin/thiamine biosynthesis adenylyltransferase
MPERPERPDGPEQHDPLIHEALYRGDEALARLAGARLVLCGVGALGSHLAEHLLRQGVRQLTVIDFDRVEQHNLGTQSYEESDIGAFKVDALRARCYRATGVEIAVVSQPLTERNAAKLLRNADLVLDTFDTSASRRLVTESCATLGCPCLHLGMSADYGEVHWNEGYRVPSDVVAPDVCAYPLARNLVLLVVALGAEVALRFLLAGQRENYSLTLRDLTINREG